jgi:microcompartment protein CcmK/EutM
VVGPPQSYGIGDRVLAVQEGFSAMTSVGHTESPIDAVVIGVVDQVETE